MQWITSSSLRTSGSKEYLRSKGNEEEEDEKRRERGRATTLQTKDLIEASNTVPGDGSGTLVSLGG